MMKYFLKNGPKLKLDRRIKLHPVGSDEIQRPGGWGFGD